MRLRMYNSCSKSVFCMRVRNANANQPSKPNAALSTLQQPKPNAGIQFFFHEQPKTVLSKRAGA